MNELPVTVVAGVGPGLGRAIAERFADGGHAVAMLARDEDKLQAWSADRQDGRLHGFGCDLAEPGRVEATFAAIEERLGVPDCVVFNASTYSRGRVTETTPETFERAWRIGCFAGFLVARAAAARMARQKRGSLIFTGATASLRGGAGFTNLASPKAALRSLVQSLARELSPQGIHVAHVVIDGQIAADPTDDATLDPAAIAEVYWQLHAQPRSAWTHELDLRPWVERF